MIRNKSLFTPILTNEETDVQVNNLPVKQITNEWQS